ncbi:hypothetical protein LEP1GSC051_1468 [Leptospira sp. P2653]|nr:hypothetical protein LEP1GSC051_1468 [Leptospira sp. P2653]
MFLLQFLFRILIKATKNPSQNIKMWNYYNLKRQENRQYDVICENSHVFLETCRIV